MQRGGPRAASINIELLEQMHAKESSPSLDEPQVIHFALYLRTASACFRGRMRSDCGLGPEKGFRGKEGGGGGGQCGHAYVSSIRRSYSLWMDPYACMPTSIDEFTQVLQA